MRRAPSSAVTFEAIDAGVDSLGEPEHAAEATNRIVRAKPLMRLPVPDIAEVCRCPETPR
jgi:hypothetical protein